MRFLFLGLIVLSGAGLAVQSAVNSRLRMAVQSPPLSATISFAVGMVFLIVLTLSGVMGRGRLTHFADMPWWAWTGGLFGAFVVTMAILGVPKVGIGGLIAGTVFGQLVAGLLLDSFGWLGVPKIPINPYRIVGALLLFAGVLLMQRK